jgi:hypothetical protein
VSTATAAAAASIGRSRRRVRLAIAVAALTLAVASRRARADDAAVVAEGARQPQVAVAPDGTVHVTFVKDGNVLVASSKDRGRTFSSPVVAIDAEGAARAAAQRGPRIGVDARGRVVVTAPVAFDPTERAKRYPTADLWITSSADGGRTWSSRVRVNSAEKQAPEALHALAVAPDGTAWVAWLDRRERKERGQDLYVARVEGDRVGENRRVASEVCECCAPGIAVDAKGNPLLAWREGGDRDSREVVGSRSTDGGAIWSKPARWNRTPTKEDG